MKVSLKIKNYILNDSRSESPVQLLFLKVYY